MNLGDGLLFELENGKPKLILLSHGVEKSHAKPLFRPRAANILSSRQPSCLGELQGEEPPSWHQTGRRKEARIKAVVAAAKERSSVLTPSSSSKKCENHNGSVVKAVTRVKSERQKQSSALGSLRSNKRSAKNTALNLGGNVGPKDKLSTGDTGHKDSVVVLTTEQLQKIISSVQTSNPSQQSAEERLQGLQSSGTLLNGGEDRGEMEEEERGGGEEMKKGESGGEGNDTCGVSQEAERRLSGCLFSWLEERQFDCRSTTENKKAQWRKELDEQVALKQQQKRLAPDRLQFDENPRSVLSSHSSLSQRDPPAAIRSSLKLGDITPVEEGLGAERREEQRRRWLEELDRQREETAERRRREKVLRSQTEEPDLWNTHFDSLQRRPPLHSTAPSAQPPAPSCMSERGDWEPSSSLSLVWEATSSCGAESVAGVSVDMTSKYPSRASYLRTMTALLDPAQIEERERRRQKQLEQQRVIEAQVEERRRQREQELAKRRQEEEEEARRIALEREMLRRQYELDTTRESHREQQSQLTDQPGSDQSGDRVQETVESTVMRERQHLEDARSSDRPYKDTAVQTDAAPFPGIIEERLHSPKVCAQLQSPAAPANNKNAALRMGKENICQPGGAGGDPYEQFARTERSKKDKKRPEWNTQKPSRRFVPASERYPVTLQRNRLDSRLKRQAELIALQERTCMSRTEPPAAPQHNNPRLCSSSSQARKGPNKIENRQNSSSNSSSERHRQQSQQAADPLPPLVQEFVPFIRTDEVTLDPLEADAHPSAQTHTNTDTAFPPPPPPAPPLRSASPPASSHTDSEQQLCKTHTQRQQEILRGLAQLRKGLLQKQRELETDLNPMLKCHEKKL